MAELETRLRAIFEQRKDKTMFIIGAPTLRYGDIVEVIDAAKGAGVEKVGIVTEGMRVIPLVERETMVIDPDGDPGAGGVTVSNITLYYHPDVTELQVR
jgi:hypothetical protein